MCLISNNLIITDDETLRVAKLQRARNDSRQRIVLVRLRGFVSKMSQGNGRFFSPRALEDIVDVQSDCKTSQITTTYSDQWQTCFVLQVQRARERNGRSSLHSIRVGRKRYCCSWIYSNFWLSSFRLQYGRSVPESALKKSCKYCTVSLLFEYRKFLLILQNLSL